MKTKLSPVNYLEKDDKNTQKTFLKYQEVTNFTAKIKKW